jgi:CRP-like cAMP-binding protein
MTQQRAQFIAAPPTGNLLLDALPEPDWRALSSRLEPAPLILNKSIYEPNERIAHVYFPTSGVISIVSVMEAGTVEVGTVGREGMAGVAVVHHVDSMPTRAFVQVAGSSLRMTAADLRQAMRDSEPLQRLLFRYAQSLFDQVAQSVACNRLHTIEERCARWLLIAHDRVGADELPLKQQFLAEMLGVHRPAVTLAAGALQRAGCIRYTRGKITVLDRAGLEAAACPCYAIARGTEERRIGMGAA